MDALTDWDDSSLLSVTTNRLRHWYRPGLLCIGDAAHAMSPIGGTGINFAIQDAVVAANRLTEPIRRGDVSVTDLASVQRKRAWQVRLMQTLQSGLTKVVLLALDPNPHGAKAPVRRLGGKLVDLRVFCAVRSRVIGFGRVHVASDHRVPEPPHPTAE